MEAIQVLHMNGGDKHETSSAQNSSFQRQVISLSDSVVEQAVTKCLTINTLTSMSIADLGCASGTNSLSVISNIIHAIHTKSDQKGTPVTQLNISLNDLPGNDFNHLFMLLPEFHNKIKREIIGMDDFFMSCVGGSFYGGLFPRNSLNLVHSSKSLQWLSQTPQGLDDKVGGKYLNKGKIYISKTSSPYVAKAYLNQFEQDFFVFLRSRAVEMVSGGQMVLSFMGRVSPDPTAEVGSHQWELFAQALTSMASQGFIDEEKIDAFNAPYYAPFAEEVKSVIQSEGSFLIDHLKEYEVSWDDGYNFNEIVKLSKGQWFAKMARAAIELMLESNFGEEIMDELFQRFGRLVDDRFAKTMKPKHIFLIISLTGV